MRLPRQLLEFRFFAFECLDDVFEGLGDRADDALRSEILRLDGLQLPPIASTEVLALLIGVNPGILWSFKFVTKRHYRIFQIPRGQGKVPRTIAAPRVALKVVQKWLSEQLGRIHVPADHAFGFIKGRSHLLAAKRHLGADWVQSFDIKNFFPSTPKNIVESVFCSLGYNLEVSNYLASICCLNQALAQGSPVSPVISNFAFASIDIKLAQIAKERSLVLTRFADDIVFSGNGEPAAGLEEAVENALQGTCWQIAKEKSSLDIKPKRLKVHGLLVGGNELRLTKGYRNKMRAFRHLTAKDKIKPEDFLRINGHIQYGNQVEKLAKQ